MGINTGSQVRHFIEGINITSFESVKANIMETASLRTDCGVCVSSYKTFTDQIKKYSPPELNISGVESSNHKRVVYKKRNGGSGGAVEDVYYSKEEYEALSSYQGAEFYKKKQARVHKPA